MQSPYLMRVVGGERTAEIGDKLRSVFKMKWAISI